MPDDLLSRLRNFEEDLKNIREKVKLYMFEMKDKTGEKDFTFSSGKVCAYDDSRELLYQHFPELKGEEGK